MGEVRLETAGDRRRVRPVEEVVGGEQVRFEALFTRTGTGLEPTGRIDRGNSRLIDSLARPGESYAAVRERLAERERLLETLATGGRTDPEAIAEAHARR